MDLTQKYESQRIDYLFAILTAVMFGSVSVLIKPRVHHEYVVAFISDITP
jgi:hypothetical protein